MVARLLILWLLGGVTSAPGMRPPRADTRTMAASRAMGRTVSRAMGRTVSRARAGRTRAGRAKAGRAKSKANAKPLLRRAPPPQRLLRYRILGQLTNPDPQLRADAAWQAGRHRIKAAYKRLRQLLRDRDPLVRRNAAYALGMIGNREAGIALVDRVPRERVPDVMVQLAIALGRLQHKSVRGFLVGLLFRRDPALRSAGITALGFMADPMDVYTVARFLRSKDAGERLTAATALGHMGSRFAIAPLLRVLSDPAPAVQSAVVESLAKLRARGAIGALIKLLPKALPPVALAVVRALRGLDALNALAPLTQLLSTTGKPRLAAETANAVSHLGGRLPTRRLLELLASRSNDVRIPAARAAGLGGVRAAIPQLARLLSHPHPTLRLACAKALGRLAAHQTVDVLLKRLRSEHGKVRAAYVRALGRMRAVTALPVLTQLLRSADPYVVAAAAEAVGEISRLDRRPVRPLGGQLALLMTVKRSALVAREGALAFARLRPRRHRKGFSRMLRLTLHTDPRVRAHAVRSLGLYRDRLATPTVLRLLGDDHLAVYSHAALATGRLHLQSNYGTLHTLLTQTSAKNHPVAHARILLAVALIDLSRRREAIRVIGKILRRGPNTPEKAELVTSIAATRGRWVLPLLQQARRSPCYLVRAAAQRELSIWPPPVKETRITTSKIRRPPRKPRGQRAAKTNANDLSGPFPTPKGRAKGCDCATGVSGVSGVSGTGVLLPCLLWALLWGLRLRAGSRNRR